MENVTGGRRDVAAPESGIRDRTTPEGTAGAASGIAELERLVERQTAVIAELRADLEEGNAKLAVPDAECRRVRGGRGENGIRRSGGDAKVLRDELARQTAENMRKDRVVERQTAVIAELRMEIERFGVETGQVREQGGLSGKDVNCNAHDLRPPPEAGGGQARAPGRLIVFGICGVAKPDSAPPRVKSQAFRRHCRKTTTTTHSRRHALLARPTDLAFRGLT